MALTKVRGSLIDMADLDLSNVGALSVDSIAGDNDANTSITFSGSDVITIATGGSGRLTIGDGALSPVTDNEIDLGTSSLEFKDAFFDGTVTSDAFAGPLTGAVTGNADTATEATNVTAAANNSTDETVYPTFVDGATGTQGIETDTGLTYNPSSGLLTTTLLAGTLNTAAQANITSLGTLTTLTVDNVIINGTTIGHTGDDDLLTFASGVLTVAGEVSMTTLDIGGTNVTADAAELNYVDGVTSAIQTQMDTKASMGKAIAMAIVFG